MDFDALIAELGRNIGLEGLAFENDGTCSVFFDEDEVFFEKHGGKLLFIASLGSAEGKEDLYRTVLEANFLGGGAALGAIGIDPDQDGFVLSRVLEGDEDYADFERSLLLFIRCLRKWKPVILEGRMPGPVPSLPPGSTVFA